MLNYGSAAGAGLDSQSLIFIKLVERWGASVGPALELQLAEGSVALVTSQAWAALCE